MLLGWLRPRICFLSQGKLGIWETFEPCEWSIQSLFVPFRR